MKNKLENPNMILFDKLPKDWKVVRGDSVFNCLKESIRKDNFEDLVFHYSIPSIQETGDGIVQDSSEIESDKILLKGGELLISKLNPRKGTIIITKKNKLPIVCSTEFVPLLPKGTIDIKYAYYLYLSSHIKDYISSMVQSVTKSHQRANPEDIIKIWIPLPPLSIQKTIADYLDKETARIDSLISAKERFIGLLEEKRKATITEAVTRGLSPDVKMKDSGVEWLGKVPKHWEVERAKWLFTERNEKTDDDEGELLTVSHITGVTKRSEKDVNMFEAETTEGYKICKKGELVINTLWAWMGAMGISPVDGIASPAYHVYTLSDKLLSEYVDAIVRTPMFASEITKYSKGVWSSRLRLYPEGFYETFFAVPPISEQKQIVDFIRKQTIRIDGLIQKTNESIELLKERRTALIGEAVTGKLKIGEKV